MLNQLVSNKIENATEDLEWLNLLHSVKDERNPDRWKIPVEAYLIKTSAQYLDLLKAHWQIECDYKLAKELGISRAAISSYRTKRTCFDLYMCRRIAQALEILEPIVITHIQIERESDEQKIQFWELYLKRLKYRYRYIYARLANLPISH